MRAGQQVILVDAAGDRRSAIVTAVSGAGSSGYKTLNVRRGDEQLSDVPHVRDRREGEPFWALEGDVIPDAQVTPPAEPFEAGPVVVESRAQPSARRRG